MPKTTRDLTKTPFATQLGLGLGSKPSRVASPRDQRPRKAAAAYDPDAVTTRKPPSRKKAPAAKEPQPSKAAGAATLQRQPEFPYFAVDSLQNFVIDLERLEAPLKLNPAEFRALRLFVLNTPGV